MASSFPYQKNETILRAEGVSLTLGGNPILRDLNGSIQNIVRPGMTQGQVVGLLGPSGIGKTQFFRILAGLQQPTAGRVTVTDKDIPVQRGMVGVVAQNYPLFAHRTVIDNLILAARRHGDDPKTARERSYAMLERFGLLNRATLYPIQLSGGQKQRVAIAQQLLCSENFLLMDEPFSGLDLIMIEEVSRMIAEVASADELNTLVIVTHDISAAAAVSDTLWLMGRERDAEGKQIPGARVIESYDLIELGLAWKPGIATDQEFLNFVRTIKLRFRDL